MIRYPALLLPLMLFILCGCEEDNTDNSPPGLAILSPLENDVIYGIVTVSVKATDATGIQSIYFWADGERISQPVLSGDTYIAYWNTTGEIDSSLHVLQVQAFDYSDNEGWSDTLRVYTDNRGRPPVAVSFTDQLSSTKHRVVLEWEQSVERDFSHYSISRTSSRIQDADSTHIIRVITDINQTSYTDDGTNTDSTRISPWGLVQGTAYYYRIAVSDTFGNQVWSDSVRVVTDDIKPVILNEVTNITPYSVNLNWTLQDQDYRYHRIHVSGNVDVGSTTADSVGSVPGLFTWFKAENLKPSTQYFFRVASVDSAWSTAKSQTINATTSPMEVVELYQPSEADISKYSIRLSWSPTTQTNVVYRVFRSTAPGVSQTDSLIAEIDEETVTEYTDTNLNPLTRYYYTIYLVDSWNNYTRSPEIYCTTKSIQKSSVKQGSVHKYYVNLSWEQSEEPDFNKYVLYRAQHSGFDTTGADLKVSLSSVLSTYYTDTDVTYGTDYYYTLAVYDDRWYSAVDHISVRTLDFDPPEIDTVFATTDQSFTIEWLLYNDPITFSQYRLYRDSIPEVDSNSPLIHVEPDINRLSFSDNSDDLVQFATYYYRLYILDVRNNLSGGSNVVTETLNSAPPPVVLHFPQSQNITSSSIPLTWDPSLSDDFWKYELYMSTGSSIEIGDNVSTRVATLTSSSQTSYTVHNLSSGIVYYFRVFVFDTGNSYSGSNIVYGLTKP